MGVAGPRKTGPRAEKSYTAGPPTEKSRAPDGGQLARMGAFSVLSRTFKNAGRLPALRAAVLARG